MWWLLHTEWKCKFLLDPTIRQGLSLDKLHFDAPILFFFLLLHVVTMSRMKSDNFLQWSAYMVFLQNWSPLKACRLWLFSSTERWQFWLSSQSSLVAQLVKNLPTVQETRVRSLGWGDPLEKEMATHSSILAWKISQTEEPGGLQSMGSQRAGHGWETNTHSEDLKMAYQKECLHAWGFPGGISGKDSTCQWRSGKFEHWLGSGNPFQ